MAVRGPGRPSNKGHAVRYIGAGLLLLLGGYFAYEFMAVQRSDSLRGVALISSCPQQVIRLALCALSMKTCKTLHCHAHLLCGRLGMTLQQQPNTTLHRIYAKDPALSIDMFTFEHDTVSKEVQDHSARQVEQWDATADNMPQGLRWHKFAEVRMPRPSLQFHLGHHLAHKFYAKTLCAASGSKLSPKKGCQGLVLDVGAFIGTHALVLAK